MNFSAGRSARRLGSWNMDPEQKAEQKEAGRDSGEFGVKERVTGLYDNMVAFVTELPRRVSSGEGIELIRLKRLIQYMVGMVTDDEPVLLGMALNKDRYPYAHRHPVDVCILSVTLGHRIGLSKNQLAELGLVAILSDIGKILVPDEVLNKEGVYNLSDRRVMERHTVLGFKTLFGVKDMDETLIKAAIVSFEHHLHYDLSGYPKVRHISGQDLNTRIVAIAEWYDALTAYRSYTEGCRSPDYAVRTLLEKAGTELDPVLVKFFISMMGVYPIGSLVVLDSGEIGIVVEPHGVLLKRPRVLVVSDAVKPFVADLSKRGDDGRYLRTIKRTLDPNEYKIDYASYFYSRTH